MNKPTYEELFEALDQLQKDTNEVYHALKRGEKPLLGIGHWRRAIKAQCMCTPEDVRKITPYKVIEWNKS